METILKYSMSGFWEFCGCYALVYTVCYFAVNGFMKIWTRLMRVIAVSIKGWPPNYLDADGDFKPKEDEKQPD